MKKILLGALVIMLLLGASLGYAYMKHLSFPKTVKVVLSTPLAWDHGRTFANAVKLAFEEANYTAGPYKLELIVLDDGDSSGKMDRR